MNIMGVLLEPKLLIIAVAIALVQLLSAILLTDKALDVMLSVNVGIFLGVLGIVMAGVLVILDMGFSERVISHVTHCAVWLVLQFVVGALIAMVAA